MTKGAGIAIMASQHLRYCDKMAICVECGCQQQIVDGLWASLSNGTYEVATHEAAKVINRGVRPAV
jgi:hypothetical protein